MDFLVQLVMSAICVVWCQALWLPRDVPPALASSTQSTSWPPNVPTWPTKTTSLPTLQTQTSSVPLTASTQLTEVSEIESERLARKQAESAVYSFGINVVDGIMDNLHARQETRKGLKLVGAYSYSDGYNKHTVYYEADQDGYRIVKDITESIGNGPRINPEGKAEVSIDINGNHNKYTISANDIAHFQTTTPADLVFRKI